MFFICEGLPSSTPSTNFARYNFRNVLLCGILATALPSGPQQCIIKQLGCFSSNLESICASYSISAERIIIHLLFLLGMLAYILSWRIKLNSRLCYPDAEQASFTIEDFFSALTALWKENNFWKWWACLEPYEDIQRLLMRWLHSLRNLPYCSTSATYANQLLQRTCLYTAHSSIFFKRIQDGAKIPRPLKTAFSL